MDVIHLGTGRRLTASEKEQLAQTIATNEIVDGLKRRRPDTPKRISDDHTA